MVKKLSFKDLMLKEFGEGDPLGDETFQGTGNFGQGNKRQLVVGLDPATQKLEDMEQAEINQNVEDLHFGLGKFGDDPRLVKGARGEEGLTEERNAADQLYSDLPGFPAMNTLENPEDHAPSDDQNERAEQLKHAEEDFLDTLPEQFGNSARTISTTPAGTEVYKLSQDEGEDEIIQNHSFLMAPRDHLNPPANDDTPWMGISAASTMSPKKHVPDDWQGDRTMTDDVVEDNFMDEDVMHLVVETVNRTMTEFLSEYSGREIRKLLKKHDCVELRQKGSHLQVKCGGCISTIPMHGSKDIKKGTMKSIEKSLGMCIGPDWTQVKRRKDAKAASEMMPEDFTGIHDETGDGPAVGGSKKFNDNKKMVLADLHSPNE